MSTSDGRPTPEHQWAQPDLVGIDRTVTPTGNLVLSVDPDKVIGLVYLVKIDQPDGSVRLAHAVDAPAHIDRAAFCEQVGSNLIREAAAIRKAAGS